MQGRILGTTVALFIVLAAFTHFFFQRYWERQLVSATESQGEAVGRAIEIALTTAMLAGQPHDAHEILGLALSSGLLDRVRLLALDGRIIHSTVLEEEGGLARSDEEGRFAPEAFPGTGVSSHAVLGRGGGLEIRFPIVNRPQCHRCHDAKIEVNGVLEMHSRMESLTTAIRQARTQSIFGAVLSVAALTMTLSILFRRHVSDPISRILTTMGKARQGDLSARVPEADGADEFGRIGRNLNEMLQELGAARAEVESLHREELRRSEHLATLGSLAAAMAHEIKNPLSGIRGAMQVIQEQMPPGAEHREIIHEIIRQVDRLDATVKDLLTYARPPQPRKTPTDLNELLRSLVLFVSHESAAENVAMELDLDPALPSLPVDPELLKQAILNLMQNALQAMPKGGRLRMSSALRGGRAVLTVSDTGAGIAEDNIERIWQPFFTTRHRGTGLGLSIARNTISAHGGTIAVTGAPGEGATFTILLPSSEEGGAA